MGRPRVESVEGVPRRRFDGREVGRERGHGGRFAAREGDETPLACALREIEEEIGYRVAPERLEPLVTLRLTYPDSSLVTGSFFILRDVPVETLVVTEGSLLAVQAFELPDLLRRMTPSACLITRLFMLRVETPTGPAM